jgi:hypothetical protein
MGTPDKTSDSSALHILLRDCELFGVQLITELKIVVDPWVARARSAMAPRRPMKRPAACDPPPMTVTTESPEAKRAKRIAEDVLGTPVDLQPSLGGFVVDLVLHDLSVKSFKASAKMVTKFGLNYESWVWEIEVSRCSDEARSR